MLLRKGKALPGNKQNLAGEFCVVAEEFLVSFAAVFWMSHNAPPKETKGGALRDIQRTAAKETKEFSDVRCLMNTLTVGNMAFSYSKRHPTEKSLNSTHAKPTELFNAIVTVTKD